MKKILKKYKYFVLSIALMLILILCSFFQYYKNTYGNVKYYYEFKKVCYEERNMDDPLCAHYKGYEEYIDFIVNNNSPQKKYKEQDAITITSTIVELTFFSYLQYISPLIIAIAVVGTIHSEYSSGMFQNYLLRMDYKKYLRKMYKISIMASLIMPISLIIIFLVATVASGFNFNISDAITNIAVYDSAKYSNFILYGIMICLIQFLISLFYSNIAAYCCKKNKNTLVAILLSYIMFIVSSLIVYLIVYAILINKILGFKELTDYFVISGYWFFDFDIKCIIPVIVSLILFSISYIVLRKSYKYKEVVICEYESQTA